MRILLSLLSAPTSISGVQRHAMQVAKALLQSDAVSHLHVLAGDWQQYVRNELPHHDERLSLEFATIKNTLIARNMWHLFDLPRSAREHDANLVHLSYPVPMKRDAFHVPVVLSLHDCYAIDIPENFGTIKALFQRRVLQKCLSAVDAIACVSESTRSRLESFAPMLALRSARVIPNSVELAGADQAMPFLASSRGPFLLCVAQHRRNKNLISVFDAYQQLLHWDRIPRDTRVVVVGAEGPESSSLRQYLQANGLAGSVSFLSGLSNEELLWCYRNARMLVAPSLVEGFGLPVAEALLAGCPVVCSDLPVFREIGGDHCRYVARGTSFVTHLAGAIREQMLAQRPLPISLPQYSSAVISQEYVRLYDELLSPSFQIIAPHPVRANAKPEWKL